MKYLLHKSVIFAENIKVVVYFLSCWADLMGYKHVEELICSYVLMD